VLYSSIVGHVRDQSGGAIPGAEVSITNVSTNLTRHTLTNEMGNYSFPNVPSGTYTVKVTMPGFGDFVRANVPVSVNDITRVDAVLQVGDVQEEVLVTTQTVARLQTDRAEVRAEITDKELVDLPG